MFFNKCILRRFIKNIVNIADLFFIIIKRNAVDALPFGFPVKRLPAFCRKAHYTFKCIDVIIANGVFNYGQLVFELLDFRYKRLFVCYKQLAPHIGIYFCYTGELSERITRKCRHIFGVTAGHKGDGDAVGKLG